MLKAESTNNKEINFTCSICSNIPLIGIEFDDNAKDVSEAIKLNYYCIYNHNNKKNELSKIDLKNIFKDKDYNITKSKVIKCENCHEYLYEYTCLRCKRNICNKYIKFHPGHKLYDNKNYYFTENKIEEIKKQFKESKEVLTKNITIIKNQIDIFKFQLQKLENIYKEYQDMNNKLINLSQYLLDEYTKKFDLKKEIKYPLYFNLKNILNFNFQKIEEFPKADEVSIKTYTDTILGKIKMGLYYLLKESQNSKNLDNYSNEDIINLNLVNLDKFNEIKIEYNNFIILNKNKILGINELDNSLEMFNLKNKKVESSMKLNITESKTRIFYKNNLIFVMTKIEIYIIDPRTFNVIQNIFLKKKSFKERSRYYWNTEEYEVQRIHEFKYLDFLSDDKIGIIYNGELSYLNADIDNLIIGLDNPTILNSSDEVDLSNTNDYTSLLIYKKNCDNIFILEKIILLIKSIVHVREVPYVCGKHDEYDNDEKYCKFYFKSLTKISENELILSFKCRIKTLRDIGYFYITERNYKNETIYYHLKLTDCSSNIKKLCSSEENTSLIKDTKDNKILFFFKDSQNCANKLKKFLKKMNLKKLKLIN